MAKKSKYADLYTMRADGRYYGWYRDAAVDRLLQIEPEYVQQQKKA